MHTHHVNQLIQVRANLLVNLRVWVNNYAASHLAEFLGHEVPGTKDPVRSTTKLAVPGDL
jgi:hypothetical protein